MLQWLALGASMLAAGCNVVSHSQNADGVRLYQQGQYQQAARRFEQAVASDPNSADSYYNLASTYHRMAKLDNRPDEWKLAEDTYNLCLDRDPNHRDCHRALAVLLVEQNRSEQAFRLLEGWSNSNPTSVDAKVELARLSQEFGNQQAARDHLLEALAINPRDPRALSAIGQIHEDNGNTAQALATYQRSLSSNSFQPDVQARVAAIRSATGAVPPSMPTPSNGTRTVNTTTPSPVVR
ncbi:MAG TPA: tetratricopeptide repeat protein [Pirellulales bacterium]|nr:tetratricopeptide repeat protein [Pirellulales bacterium]